MEFCRGSNREREREKDLGNCPKTFNRVFPLTHPALDQIIYTVPAQKCDSSRDCSGTSFSPNPHPVPIIKNTVSWSGKKTCIMLRQFKYLHMVTSCFKMLPEAHIQSCQDVKPIHVGKLRLRETSEVM